MQAYILNKAVICKFVAVSDLSANFRMWIANLLPVTFHCDCCTQHLQFTSNLSQITDWLIQYSSEWPKSNHAVLLIQDPVPQQEASNEEFGLFAT